MGIWSIKLLSESPPRNISHADFISSVSDSDGSDFWVLHGDFEKHVDRRREFINAFTSHVVAAVLVFHRG